MIERRTDAVPETEESTTGAASARPGPTRWAAGDEPHTPNGPGLLPGAGQLASGVGQEAAGDSLGLSRAGVDGLDRSGLVVDTAGVDDAAGLLHAAIAPTSAMANRILLSMMSPRLRPPAGQPGAGKGSLARDRAVPVASPYGLGRKRTDCRAVVFRLQTSRSRLSCIGRSEAFRRPNRHDGRA